MTRMVWIIFLLSSAAAAQTPNPWNDATVEELLAEQTDTADERGSEPGADPWTVADPAQLFSRPTLGEVLKVGAETQDEGTAFSLNMSLGLLADRTMHSQLLSGLQLVSAYSTDAKELTAGIKANYSLRDPRAWSNELRRRLDAEYTKACPQNPGEAVEVWMTRCHDTGSEAMDAVTRAGTNFLPSFSLGLATGYSFSAHTLAKAAATLAVEVPFSNASLVLNGNLENAEVSAGRRRTSGGPALALTWKPRPPFSKEALDVSLAGKWTACLSECDEDSSSVEFGPRIGLPVTKDSVLAASLSWKGSGKGPFSPFLGLAFSRSFGIEKQE